MVLFAECTKLFDLANPTNDLVFGLAHSNRLLHAGKLRHLLKLREMLEAGGEHHFVENIDAAPATENFSRLSQFRAGVEEKPSD